MINTIEVRYKGEPVGALSYNKGDTISTTSVVFSPTTLRTHSRWGK